MAKVVSWLGVNDDAEYTNRCKRAMKRACKPGLSYIEQKDHIYLEFDF